MSEKIKDFFSKIPLKYDLINKIISFSLDDFWRKRLAREAKKIKKSPVLDLCTGTGKQAFFLKEYLKEKVYAIDFCFPMLKEAKKIKEIRFIAANAKNLPFKDEKFGIVTISFATRNLNTNKDELLKCFLEFKRVLKNDGIFLNLETTQPPFFPLKLILYIYLKTFVKEIGYLISGSKEAYSYLSNSIPKFYKAKELKKILIEAGFSMVRYKYLFPYVIALHFSKK